MNQEAPGPDVIDLASYRASKRQRLNDDEIITDVHFCITRGGAIIPNPARVAQLHTLIVLTWCLEMSADMLETYLDTAH